MEARVVRGLFDYFTHGSALASPIIIFIWSFSSCNLFHDQRDGERPSISPRIPLIELRCHLSSHAVSSLLFGSGPAYEWRRVFLFLLIHGRAWSFIQSPSVIFLPSVIVWTVSNLVACVNTFSYGHSLKFTFILPFTLLCPWCNSQASSACSSQARRSHQLHQHAQPWSLQLPQLQSHGLSSPQSSDPSNCNRYENFNHQLGQLSEYCQRLSCENLCNFQNDGNNWSEIIEQSWKQKEVGGC